MTSVALIGNYPPRRCGIATFTHDVAQSLLQAGQQCFVVAMNDTTEGYDYPPEVVFTIQQQERTDYKAAADFINEQAPDVVCLQHEYGIFGGEVGRYILHLLKRVNAPIVTTLHTVLDEPDPAQKEVLQAICQLSQKVVTMSKLGIQLLIDVYGVDPARIVHIHHGIHPINHINPQLARRQLGLPNKPLLLTFGLLSRNKSIETVLHALPEVVKEHPDFLYVVLGATHPHVRKNDGEEYRHFLQALVQRLNLQDHVLFVDRFVTNEELFQYLRACDLYIIPYQSEKQITSGTLVYAMGSQSAIISTPFWYAKEMLADNRGRLFGFDDAQALAGHINELMNDPEELNALRQRAYDFSIDALWPNVAQRYIRTFDDARAQAAANANPAQQDDNLVEVRATLPPLRFSHLQVMSDDTGLLQHACYNVPDRSHGYCIDDNARALLFTVMAQQVMGPGEQLNRLQSSYISFIDYAWNPVAKRFRNFMSYQRAWLEDVGSEDSQGRTLWALGYAAVHAYSDGHLSMCQQLFQRSLGIAPSLTHPRAIAYALLGLGHYLSERPHDGHVKELIHQLADRLYQFFEPHAQEGSVWPWHDHKVSYGNSRIPQALLLSGDVLGENRFVDMGIRLLDWLIKQQFVGGTFSPIGNADWLTKQGKARYDQQPLEAHGMMDACYLAAGITGRIEYVRHGQQAFNWFLGDNDVERALYDYHTGACMDGLHPGGVNLNQGAESTLSWLISLCTMHRISLPENKELNTLYEHPQARY